MTDRFWGVLAAFTGVWAACALFAGTAAAGTPDQQQTNNGGGSYPVHQTQSLAQTFTAGITGGLDQVDLTLRKFGTPTSYLSVEIRDVSGSSPGGRVLAGHPVPSSGVPTSPSFVSVVFAPPAPVVAGTRYAIVLYSSTSPANAYDWLHSAAANPYVAGGTFNSTTSPPSGWTPIAGNYDQSFKTYVVPVAASGPTGQRAAALKKCKKQAKKRHWTKARLKKCRKKANNLPV